MSKRFMYVCFGLLALAIAFHIGANSAGAQARGAISPVVGITANMAFANGLVILENGEVYGCTNVSCPDAVWVYCYNIFDTAVKVEDTSWGAIKHKFR